MPAANDNFARFGEPLTSAVRLDVEQLTFLVAGVILAGMHAGKEAQFIGQTIDSMVRAAVDEAQLIRTFIRGGRP
jgi:hypothetical protein